MPFACAPIRYERSDRASRIAAENRCSCGCVYAHAICVFLSQTTNVPRLSYFFSQPSSELDLLVAEPFPLADADACTSACLRGASASAPEIAVSEGGQVKVSSGSQIAVCGINSGLATPTFIIRSGSARTATGVTSDPVPAVVGSQPTAELVPAL